MPYFKKNWNRMDFTWAIFTGQLSVEVNIQSQYKDVEQELNSLALIILCFEKHKLYTRMKIVNYSSSDKQQHESKKWIDLTRGQSRHYRSYIFWMRGWDKFQHKTNREYPKNWHTSLSYDLQALIYFQSNWLYPDCNLL